MFENKNIIYMNNVYPFFFIYLYVYRIFFLNIINIEYLKIIIRNFLLYRNFLKKILYKFFIENIIKV